MEIFVCFNGIFGEEGGGGDGGISVIVSIDEIRDDIESVVGDEWYDIVRSVFGCLYVNGEEYYERDGGV